MSDPTPLSIADQLSRYGDAVEASYGPVDRRHSQNGGPVSVIDRRVDADDLRSVTVDDTPAAGGSATQPGSRSRLILIAAVVVVLLVSAAILAGLFNQPDNLITDDVETTTTTAPDSTSTSLTTVAPDSDEQPPIDTDAATIPSDLRALSTSPDWVPIGVSLIRLSDGSGEAGSAEDEHYEAEAAAFHMTDPAVLYLWIIERGSPYAADDAGSIDAATPWGDGLHSGLSWVDGDARYLFQASALDDQRQAPTGAALKDMARTMTPGDDGWDLPGAELLVREQNDGPTGNAGGEAGYAQITWAPLSGGTLDMTRTVTQTTRRGGLTDMISELHEAGSLGTIRLVPARDGTVRFVIDEGEMRRYALAAIGSTVVNWQGAGGPALDQLVTDTEVLDDGSWNRAWADSARLVDEWAGEHGDTTPTVRLMPDSSWEPVSAVDPSLWSPIEQFEHGQSGFGRIGHRRWFGAFQAMGTTSPLPE